MDIEELKRIVDEQANDEGLWFVAKFASEDRLQRELRRLHAAIEAVEAPQQGNELTPRQQLELAADLLKQLGTELATLRKQILADLAQIYGLLEIGYVEQAADYCRNCAKEYAPQPAEGDGE